MPESEFLIIMITNFVIPATLLVILALGLNIQWGYTGLFNAGVGAFAGVGGYLFGMLTTGSFFNPVTEWQHWGPSVPWGILPAAIVAMVAAGVLGVLVAIPTIRLRADYLAIATLAMAEIIRLIFKNERRLTGGDLSLSYIPRPFAGSVPTGAQSDLVFMVLAAGIGLAILILVEFLGTLPWGRGLRAVREDEDVAQALGKNAFRLKLGAFAVGCAIMGLFGALQGSYFGSLFPDSYASFLTFTAFTVVILGGSGNPRGVVLGGYVFYLFIWGAQQLRVYVERISTDLALRIDFFIQIIIGLLLVLFILYRPEGIIPERRYVPRAAE